MGASSCGTTTDTKNTPDKSSDTGSTKEKKAVARIGDSITLGTSDTKLQMTVTDVLDPVSGNSDIDQPESGKRFVGVKIAVKNVGSKTYSDALSNGSQMVDSNDEQASTTILSEGECGNSFASSLRLSPGSRQVGCIPFEVRKGAKPKSFQFAGDSGFGPDNAEWKLKK
jgi:hypothetical protein